ncbi:MAG: oligoendopeptidase F [Clostridia bacterium]|nr:oligoendopeptidase F [Clostridia bacterium]MBR0444231.1 oligoendopeptidase F [Clostridia bacterium]
MAKTRKEIDPKYQWKLEDIFDSDESWEKEFGEAGKLTEQIGSFRGNLGSSSDRLYEALSLASDLSLKAERLFVYAHMRKDEDNGNTKYQGMTDRAMQIMVEMGAESSYFEPEMLAIPEDLLAEWSREERFARFRTRIADLNRKRAHVLSSGEERILAMAEDPLTGPENSFTMLSDVDLKFGTVTDGEGNEVQLTHGTYGLLIMDPDRNVRREAYEKLYAAYGSVKNTIAAMYTASVKADVFRARARGYDGALEEALFANNVPVSVYEQLIEAVHEKLPALRKYMEIRKRCLGVDRLEMYDLYTPLVPECNIPMEFEEARDIVKKALAPLGTHYAELLDKAFAEGWIDIYENEGKTSGAYSWGVYGVHPYVLLNHQNDLSHASTLAHELGHAMHSYHSNAAQPYETSEYATMVAEVASTVNEMLLKRYYLARETDPRKRAYILNELLEDVRTTCFRQTMFAEFEMKAHRMAEAGEALTVDSLSDLYRSLNELYYPDVHVDDNIALEWMRIPHFYHAFYVYQYATGICTAIALSNAILEKGETDRYIAFLSSGGSDYPVNLLKEAGVDLTKKESILSALDEFESRVEELNSLLGGKN